MRGGGVRGGGEGNASDTRPAKAHAHTHSNTNLQEVGVDGLDDAVQAGKAAVDQQLGVERRRRRDAGLAQHLVFVVGLCERFFFGEGGFGGAGGGAAALRACRAPARALCACGRARYLSPSRSARSLPALGSRAGSRALAASGENARETERESVAARAQHTQHTPRHAPPARRQRSAAHHSTAQHAARSTQHSSVEHSAEHSTGTWLATASLMYELSPSSAYRPLSLSSSEVIV